MVTISILNLLRRVSLIQLTDLDMDLNIFDGSSVCRKAQKILKVVYPMLSFIVVAEHTCHNVFKGWSYIKEITKLCREDKVC